MVLFWFLTEVCCLYPLVHGVGTGALCVSEHAYIGKYAHALHGSGQYNPQVLLWMAPFYVYLPYSHLLLSLTFSKVYCH